MKLPEARTLFVAELLSTATVYRHTPDSGWCLRFESVTEIGIDLVIETNAGGLRVFKTAEAAILTAERVGFKEIAVKL
jgi:hypothetical protein